MSDVQNVLHSLRKLSRKQRLILDEIGEELDAESNINYEKIEDFETTLIDIMKLWKENKSLFFARDN